MQTSYINIKNITSGYFRLYTGLSTESYLIFFLNFINSILISICYFLPLYLMQTYRINISATSYIISFYGMGTIFGGILGGKLADKFNPKLITLISVLAQGLLFLNLFFSISSITIGINLFFLGVFTYSFLTTSYYWALLICEENERHKLKTISILESISNLGLGVSAIFIGNLPQTYFNFLFLAGGICLISLFIFGNFIKSAMHSHSQLENKPHIINRINLKENTKIVIYFVLFCLFIVGIIISQLSTTYALFITSIFKQTRINTFSLLFALNTFLVVMFQTPITKFISRFNPIIIIGIGIFLLGHGMLLLSCFDSMLWVFIACIIYTIGEILFFSVAQLLCYENSNHKGSVLGYFRLTYALSKMVGVAFGGYVYENFGSQVLWYLCGIIGGICLLTSLFFKKFKSDALLKY